MSNENINIEIVFDELDNELDNNVYPLFLNYQLNYNIKQLTFICDYYGIKIKKFGIRKEDIINKIIIFESDSDNHEKVSKRLNMWFYMEELKKDTFMKKYVLF
jgi:hypothetical protein